MSSYMVLAVVSGGLRRILWDAIRADSVTQSIVGTEDAIVFSNPKETARDSANRLSLWLYQISENEHGKNLPNIRADRAVNDRRIKEQFPPLALDLYYLLTPFAPSGESDHLLLGKSMQALYDNASTLLVNNQAHVAEELRIVLFRRSVEELTRIWEALQEPYRLSICYQVSITRIDSQRELDHAPVIELTANYRSSHTVVGR